MVDCQTQEKECPYFKDLSVINCKGQKQVKRLIERTTTSTDLTVTVQIVKKVYQSGKKVAKGFKESMRILLDKGPEK